MYLVPLLSFKESSYTVKEDEGKLNLTLVLSHPASQTIEVTFYKCSNFSNNAESKSFLALYVAKLSEVCILLSIADI